MPIPTKLEFFYILEMLDAELLDSRFTHPWAEQLIARLDSVPPWLGDLATQVNRRHQAEAIRQYLCSEPFEAGPDGLEKFHVACLFLRYERRELSWATFLRLAGEHLDAVNGEWDCETPYRWLNVYEDADFSEGAEARTREEYLAEQDLRPWIALAREKFEPFRQVRRTGGTQTSA
jgi:hypothetical protein